MDAGNAPAQHYLQPGHYLMNTTTISRVPSVAAAKQEAEPLFRSAHAALTFALNYSMQQYDRPLMNRAMAGRSSHEGKGLFGTDGAGQAGMIRAELDQLLPIHKAVLIASVGPWQVPCSCKVSCCSGWKPNAEWEAAMSQLTTLAAGAALSGCVSNGRVRSALIQRLLGAKVTLAEIAERFDVCERTVTAHSLKIKRWLFGSQGKSEEDSKLGLHQEAYAAITRRLQNGGLVGETNESNK